MDTDYSVELGRDDPVLDFPWTDTDEKFAYHDLKRHPELLARVPEAVAYPELAEFLRAVNSRLSMVESAKCDAWTTDELTPEEEVFGASHKAASYVDLVLSHADRRQSLPFYERLAKRMVELLRKTPETYSSAEFCIRRCYFTTESDPQEGLYLTVYVNGYGHDAPQARQNWGIALRLVGNAIVQLSVSGLT